MKTLAGISTKIEVADELHGVVKTMKTMAASKISQLGNASEALDDYYRTVELGLTAWLLKGGETTAGETKEKDGRNIVAIVFGSDLGLVGQFNEKLAEYTVGSLSAEMSRKELWVFGRQIDDKLKALGFSSYKRNRTAGTVESITVIVESLMKEIDDRFGQNPFTEFYIYYNHLDKDEGYRSVSQRILPLDENWIQGVVSKWPNRMVPDVVGDPKSMLKLLIREYLFVSLFRSCTQSMLSENTSRLKAMQHAEKTIDDVKEELTMEYHQLRQSTIDEEMFDIISGFQSLSKKKKG